MARPRPRYLTDAIAAERAYAQAGVKPSDIQIVERGNETEATCPVQVPHSAGQTAGDDGPAYSVTPWMLDSHPAPVRAFGADGRPRSAGD